MDESVKDGIAGGTEASLPLTDALESTFQTGDRPLNTYAPLVLAYIGDAVFELCIREVIVRRGNARPKDLNRRVTGFVSAKAQSAALARIEPSLSEEESAVVRRGRNAHPGTMAKNASVSEYLAATGFEALIGYLYLSGRTGRITELLRAAYPEL